MNLCSLSANVFSAFALWLVSFVYFFVVLCAPFQWQNLAHALVCKTQDKSTRFFSSENFLTNFFFSSDSMICVAEFVRFAVRLAFILDFVVRDCVRQRIVMHTRARTLIVISVGACVNNGELSIPYFQFFCILWHSFAALLEWAEHILISELTITIERTSNS